MQNSRASIVIPADTCEIELLRESIESALNQNYPNIEVIVASSMLNECVSRLVETFNSQVRHVINHSTAPNTTRIAGEQAATGNIVFYLSPGDKFHQNKIREHVVVREKHPDVVLSYNAKFLVDSNDAIWHQTSFSPTTNITDFIDILPIQLSEIAIQRDWITRIGSFNDRYGSTGGDINFLLRCVSAGCKVVGIDKPLNYHQLFTDAYRKNITDGFDSLIRAFDDYFYSQQCPQEGRNRRNQIIGKVCCEGAHWAFIGNQTSDGQELVRRAIQADRSLLDGQAAEFLEPLIVASLFCEEEVESVIRRVFSQLPPELAWITQYTRKVIANTLLQRGIAGVLYGRENQAEIDFVNSAMFGIQLQGDRMQKILSQVLDYEATFGSDAARRAINIIDQNLKNSGLSKEGKWLKGTHFINRSFDNFQKGCYDLVISDVIETVCSRPSFLLNSGVLSISLRSLRKLL